MRRYPNPASLHTSDGPFTKMAYPLTPDGGQMAKRKHEDSDPTSDPQSKKARLSDVAGDTEITSQEHNPTTAATAATAATTTESINNPLAHVPHNELLSELKGKYEVKVVTIISSTSINKRVDTILQHLGRFHPWDLSVLPGVVLLFAESSCVNKLISIIEIVHRRIHEADQKWYQYNRLSEQQIEILFTTSKSGAAGTTVVEDTMMVGRGGEGGGVGAGAPSGDDDEEQDDFEVMQTKFWTATETASRIKRTAYLSTFLSRVPVPELAAKEHLTTQSNEDTINYLRRKRNGLA